MPLTNAKFSQFDPKNKKLLYYILVTGHSQDAMGYQWSENHPKAWMIGKTWLEPFYLEREGVIFAIIDYAPRKKNIFYDAAMLDVLQREGLIGE